MYVRIACVINLQKVYELLEEAWMFLLALDMSTHISTFYLDIRIRLHLNRHVIVNVHLVAIPVYERDTDVVILDTEAKALDVQCPSWKDIIISVLTGGKRKMTGRISDVATPF